MMRSLYSGVAGLKNHQIQMDVIGNNIANVNTIGYKAGRVTFQDSLSQVLQNGMGPNNTLGGVNPMNVGLGMSVAAIDKIFSQGNLESTNNKLDLAIQGDAFFVLSDGNQEVYSRAGNFTVDGAGNLVLANTGYRVKGRMADPTGNIASETEITEVSLPFGQKAPAKATSTISFTGNLDSESLQTNQELGSSFAESAQIVSDAWSAPITLTAANNELTIEIDNNAGGTVSDTLTLTEKTYDSMSELLAEINNKLSQSHTLAGEVAVEFQQSGGNEMLKMRTVDEGGANTTLSLSGSFAGAGTSLNLSTTAATGTTATTLLNDLSFVDGVLDAGDEIRINGTNHDGQTAQSVYTYAAGDTVQDLLDALNSAFAGSTVSLTSDGQLSITDAVGGASKTSATLTIFDQATSNVVTMPGFVVTEEGSDAGEHITSVTIYDSKGKTHNVAARFSNISSAEEPGLWRWEAVVDDGAITPSAGNRGVVKFNPDGSLAYFEVEDGSPLTFEPGDGGAPMSVSFDAGLAGNYDGITQLSSPSTNLINEQDGYEMGDLYNISFDETGTITGHFTNGVNQILAQVAVATFNNASGLEQQGENLFKMGGNSGTAVKGWAGSTIIAEIAPGALEMSNVDLVQEFTNMIIAQRGFQANARVITTGDILLDEVVRLKR